ncbi:MAG: IPT/TIG domain-containing protein [Spirochaetaceae bacterium]|nr:IPT/TIG domain-containing protein [Spirochaetaceae bacterium]
MRPGPGVARAMAALLLVAAASFAISRFATPSPRLHALAPQVTTPGRVVSLQGRFFGRERGTSAVSFAGGEPRTSAYRSWSDERIVVVVPASFASGLVRVVTPAGASNGILLTHRDDLPSPVADSRQPGSPPVVREVSPSAAAVGEHITISGAGFGASPGAVRFTAAAGGEGAARPNPVIESSSVDLDHVRWSDRLIVVRVPAGVRSGEVSVRNGTGQSAAHEFEVRSEVGTVRYLDPRGYAATYAVSIAAAGAAGGGELYLWIPAIPETSAQRHLAEPSVNERPIQRDPAGVGLFRFHDPVSGVSREVRSDYRIRRYAIQTAIEPSSVRGYRTDSAFHERFTGGDAVVPSGGNLPAIAERAMRGYVNPLWRARLTFDYVVARLQPVAAAGARIAPAGAGPMQVVAAAIDERRAAPYEYALTFSAVARAAGIPARPVAGYLIDDSARAVPHYWAEFFLEDFGWVPVDPAMEAGASLPARPADDAAVDPWFGRLDSRRIVIAKGISDPQPIARARRFQRPEVPGLQTAHEDVVGATSEYRTNWLGLTVTDRF